MGVVGVYDWDYFHYSHVIPNLECAKIVAWRKKHQDIALLTPKLDPTMYTQFYFRKDYEDGIYDPVIQLPNVTYGGRAFSEVYQPQPFDYEKIVPDFSIYEKYKTHFGTSTTDLATIKTILNSTHFRLSPNGKNIEQLDYNLINKNNSTVILHDYDLGAVPHALEAALDISNCGIGARRVRIGTKYPVQIHSYKEFKRWLEVEPSGKLFAVQFNGQLTDEQVIELTEMNAPTMRKMYYNFLYGCADEDDFVVRVLPKIYKQIVFLRNHNQPILLNIDQDFFKTQELADLMGIINLFYDNNPSKVVKEFRTLYAYCHMPSRWKAIELYKRNYPYTKQQIINAFQYMRIKNYEVFDMFYSMPIVEAKGGKLV